MFTCPKCATALARARSAVGVFWACTACRGRAVTMPVLRKVLDRDFLNALWQGARGARGVRRRPCPVCGRIMTDVPIAHGDYARWLDTCGPCQLVWFDPGEFEGAPAAPPPAPTEPEPSPSAREAEALAKVEEIGRRPRGIEDEGGPENWWEVVPALLGMPVEEDNPVACTPWLTWALVGAISLVGILTFPHIHRAAEGWGLVPAEAFRCGGLTLITSFFLHGGWLHLIGNMYFLWIFGDNVEDCLGKLRYGLLILVAAVAGDLLYTVVNPHATTPSIGASGGISGVIAFYALQYPRARLGIFWRYFFVIRRFSMPASAAFVLWVLMQAFGAWMQMSGFSHVNALAHLGGAAVGFLFWLVGIVTAGGAGRPSPESDA